MAERIAAVRATADTAYAAADVPTMYFVGVTTGASSIMRVFPLWAQRLGLGGAGAVRLVGVDCKPRDEPGVYRRIVEHIKGDRLSLGALVTTHKIDLLAACGDLFDELDDHAERMGEVSSIYKRGGKLCGSAKDAITSGLALASFLPAGHWAATGGGALVLGAGGASVALTTYLIEAGRAGDGPTRIVVTDRDAGRLDEMRAIHGKLAASVPIAYHHTPEATDNDALVDAMAPGSLVVNATGLGKDGPGSPITEAARLPEGGLVWELNYRGELAFLRQAMAQREERGLCVEDGWVYFIHGWTSVIADVFDVEIASSGAEFDALCRIAAAARE